MNVNTDQASQIVLENAINYAPKEFGSRLIACYAIGSIAHGGFSPQVSDIDLSIILNSPLLYEDYYRIEAIKNHVKNLKIPLAKRLSIFWGSIASLKNKEAGGRFPSLDRLDLLEHGKLLSGEDIRREIPKPTKREIEVFVVKYALNFLETYDKFDSFRQPTKVFERGVIPLTKIILFPLRFLYTISTGRIVGKDEAGAYYLERNKGHKAELVKLALSWRHSLFIYNKDTDKLMRTALIPLYVQFIDAYHSKMLAYDEFNLAGDLEYWRNKLVNLFQKLNGDNTQLPPNSNLNWLSDR